MTALGSATGSKTSLSSLPSSSSSSSDDDDDDDDDASSMLFVFSGH